MSNSGSVSNSGPIESPCVRICVVHPQARICTGCLRTIDEITQWTKLSPEARAAVMAELPSREGLLKVRRGGRKARLADRSAPKA